MKKEFSLTDEEYEEYQKVVDSNENIENLNHRRIHRKLERMKQKHDLKNQRQNSCITQ